MISKSELDYYLTNWANWVRSGNRLNIGYPRCSPEQMMRGDRAGPALIETNDSAELVDHIVGVMSTEYPAGRAAIIAEYVDYGTQKIKAEKLRMSISTYKIEVLSAERFVHGAISAKLLVRSL